MADKKKEEKKEPTIFDILEKDHKSGEEYLKTVDYTFDKAAVFAREKLMKDNKYSLAQLDEALDNNTNNIADKYADEIVGHFLEHGKERYKWNLDGISNTEKDRMVHFLSGVSRSELKGHIVKYGSGYHEVHKQLKSNHLNTLTQSHRATLAGHITGDNIEKIVNKLGLDIDKDKLKIMKENPDHYKDQLIGGYVEMQSHKKALNRSYK